MGEDSNVGVEGKDTLAVGTWDTNVGGNRKMSIQPDLPSSHDYPLFIELAELDNLVWREASRWVKYQEDIESEGQRWSKPFVPSIQLGALMELKKILQKAEVNLNVDVDNEEKACRLLVDTWIHNGTLDVSQRTTVLQSLLRPHMHLYETSASIMPEFMRSNSKSQPLKPSHLAPNRQSMNRRGSILSVVYEPPDMSKNQQNKNFLRKIPRNSESANIMVAQVPGLNEPKAAFVRLVSPAILGNFTEVPLPTRFIFVLLLPPNSGKSHLEIGRCMGTLFTDPKFKTVAYESRSQEEVLIGIENFLNEVSILPPAVWSPSTRLQPHVDGNNGHGAEDDEEEGDDGLTRSGKLFGGLYQDIRRKLPWYISDFRDAFSLQVLSTWLFIYFACLTPMITFGGLMGEATHEMMGTMETIVSGCVSGVGFALFGGQPLIILGSTGPVLVFEKILVNFAESNTLNYLEFRLWVGLWIAALFIVIVVTEASSLVRYITKFTEDNFATLVACIFMFEAIKNVIEISEREITTSIAVNYTNQDAEINETLHLLVDKLESEVQYGVFLMSLLLFFGTFFVSFMLKEFRLSPYFPTWFRYLISDFGVILAILSMTLVDYFSKFDTPKLNVPETFAPTSSEREWMIPPIKNNPTWSIFAACVPALLATILIFMDQQITAVIVNRKDHKLQKGKGYHLDLFVLSILIAVCSIFGLPWFVAATVESLTNINSLKMESESAAPGEKPKFLGVREQRVSNLLVFITVGLSVLLTPVLKNVPMPVLYGVFLYMGFSALLRMELFHRITLLFMPQKYQPDLHFLRKVPLKRIHLFTIIQVICLAVLWAIKSISVTAIGFPLMLVVMMFVRKGLDWVFTQNELLELDDALPGAKIKKLEDDENVMHISDDLNGRKHSVLDVVSKRNS